MNAFWCHEGGQCYILQSSEPHRLIQILIREYVWDSSFVAIQIYFNFVLFVLLFLPVFRPSPFAQWSHTRIRNRLNSNFIYFNLPFHDAIMDVCSETA